ncbi:hypothetical protein M569_02374, partial [Genlisea aurea]
EEGPGSEGTNRIFLFIYNSNWFLLVISDFSLIPFSWLEATSDSLEFFSPSSFCRTSQKLAEFSIWTPFESILSSC